MKWRLFKNTRPEKVAIIPWDGHIKFLEKITYLDPPI